MHEWPALSDLAAMPVRDIRMVLLALTLLIAAAALWLAVVQASRITLHRNRLHALAEAASDGVLIVRAGHIVEANAALVRLMGVGPAWFEHRRLTALLDLADAASCAHPLEQGLILPDGNRHPVEVVMRPVVGSPEHVLTIRDLTPHKATQARIQRLTHSDLLTGVGNRQALEKILGKMISMADRSGVGFALLRIDLDRFKAMNESLGPAVGDQVLVQAARRLIATVREVDTVARIGSDEFGIVQPLAGKPSDAAAMADRIINEMALPFLVEGHTIVVGASVGIALYPDDGATPGDLMTRGALALNRAKKAGRGVWRYCAPGMDQVLREQQTLAQDIGVALENGQFSLVYQPFFDTATLQVVGYEALLRWAHPDRGMVSPAKFIPIAEECGLIVPISLWVLRTACAEAATWSNPLSVTVNLSPAHFLQENVADRVGAVLLETGLEPGRLELEITEGVLMDDTERALATLTALRQLGVTLAMDDFGTGYSSLSYLKKFPFDKLKIDRSFIRDLDDDPDAQPIVQAIIALSRSLRLSVTAEGVETKRQLAYLRQEDCRFVQGFLLGEPQPASQLRWTTRPVGWDPATLPLVAEPAPLHAIL